MSDKKQRRIDRFRLGSDWRHEQSLSRRYYESYESYLTHQVQKLDGLRSRLDARASETIAIFRRRFELLPLRPASSVLCLGARLGHEVAAFIALGHFAVGIDLNPGEDNPYVVTGDFHKIVFADRSVDCIYMNSLDHTLDLPELIFQVRRVLKIDGLFAANIVYGYEEGFWAGEYETLHWPTALGFAKILAEIGGFKVESTRDLTDVGSPRWLQCVFRP